MPYQAEISRNNPSCFLFLIDQSGSMEDKLGESSKASLVADAINGLLQNLVIKCAKDEGVRDYYHVGVLGYANRIGSAFTGALSGRQLVPISEIANHPTRLDHQTRRLDDGSGGYFEQMIRSPIWFDPVANGGTPMCQTLERATVIIQDWLNRHPFCFPPIVINITDGESTDGNPTDAARELQRQASSDGNVLLFNLHISSARPNLSPVEQLIGSFQFPDTPEGLPDAYARLLFEISSPLPEYMREMAGQEGLHVNERTRGLVFNAGDLDTVIRFLDIGTMTRQLR